MENIQKELCYSHVYEKFTECLNGLKKAAYSIWNEKPLLQLGNAPWKPPADPMDISDDESSEVVDPNSVALVLYRPPLFRPRGTRKKVPTLMIDLDTLFLSVFCPRSASSTSKVVSTEDDASTSVVLEILKELKQENEALRERLDTQDETNKEIKTWM